MFNLDDAFYRPLWIRIVVVVFCLGWALFEFLFASPIWGSGFAAIGLYSAYRFFITFNPPSDDKEKKP